MITKKIEDAMEMGNVLDTSIIPDSRGLRTASRDAAPVQNPFSTA
ncbi:MAG: hypothetical protein AAF909_02825 [Pseudomonadota bacterium]